MKLTKAAHHIFGNAGRWHERLRELWQFRGLENFLRDISFSARMLKKSPGFTTVALLTLAIGIGANTAIFSLINGLLLRPLPVPHADRLVVLRIHEHEQPAYSFSSPLFRGRERQHKVFSNVFAFRGRNIFRCGTDRQSTPFGECSPADNFSRRYDTPPLLGRTSRQSTTKPAAIQRASPP